MNFNNFNKFNNLIGNRKSNRSVSNKLVISFNIISVVIMMLSVFMLVFTSNLMYVLLLLFSISMFVVMNLIVTSFRDSKNNEEKYVEIISKKNSAKTGIPFPKQSEKRIEDVRKILAEREFDDFENLKQIDKDVFEYTPDVHVDVDERIGESKQNTRNILKNKLDNLIKQSEKEMSKTFSNKKSIPKNTKKKITKKKTTQKKQSPKKKTTKKAIKKTIKKKTTQKKQSPKKKAVKKATKKKVAKKKPAKKKTTKKKTIKKTVKKKATKKKTSKNKKR